MFGSEKQAVGQHFRMKDGTRVEVVGIAEDGGSGGGDVHVRYIVPFCWTPGL
jgi:hypothetical protein